MERSRAISWVAVAAVAAGAALHAAAGSGDSAPADPVGPPQILDVSPAAAFPGWPALLTIEGPATRRARVWLGNRRVAPGDVVAEPGEVPGQSRLRVVVPRTARPGDHLFRVRTKAGEAVATKAFSVVKCTVEPEPIDIKPLGEKVTVTATLRGPGGTHREFATPYVSNFGFGGFMLQGCAEPDDADTCARTMVLTLGYDPAATTTGAFTLLQCTYVESTDFAHGAVQDASWQSSGYGALQITKSTPTRIGGYFTATVEAQSQAAHDIVERFTVQGSFVTVRP